MEHPRREPRRPPTAYHSHWAGFGHPQYLVLLALWDRAPRTVRDIGETLRHEPATLSPMLKRLEALGYVTRARSARDERALAVDLTDKGRELRREAEKIPYRVVEALGMELSELEELHAALSRVLAATHRTPGETSPVS